MRQYQLDEISKGDIPRVREYLHEHAQASSLDGYLVGGFSRKTC